MPSIKNLANLQKLSLKNFAEWLKNGHKTDFSLNVSPNKGGGGGGWVGGRPIHCLCALSPIVFSLTTYIIQKRLKPLSDCSLNASVDFSSVCYMLMLLC